MLGLFTAILVVVVIIVAKTGPGISKRLLAMGRKDVQLVYLVKAVIAKKDVSAAFADTRHVIAVTVGALHYVVRGRRKKRGWRETINKKDKIINGSPFRYEMSGEEEENNNSKPQYRLPRSPPLYPAVLSCILLPFVGLNEIPKKLQDI